MNMLYIYASQFAGCETNSARTNSEKESNCGEETSDKKLKGVFLFCFVLAQL